jgi:hypothetical protein
MIKEINANELRTLLNEQEQQTTVFDPQTLDVESIKSQINAPYVSARISTLGGYGRASLMMAISLDPKEDWANNIFENSNHMRFSLGQDGLLDQFVLSVYDKSRNRVRGIKKFRKTMVKSTDEMITKINKYINHVNDELVINHVNDELVEV